MALTEMEEIQKAVKDYEEAVSQGITNAMRQTITFMNYEAPRPTTQASEEDKYWIDKIIITGLFIGLHLFASLWFAFLEYRWRCLKRRVNPLLKDGRMMINGVIVDAPRRFSALHTITHTKKAWDTDEDLLTEEEQGLPDV